MKIIEQLFQRAELAKEDGDYSYFSLLLYVGEGMLKCITAGTLAALPPGKDRNSYSLHYKLVRADSVGAWQQCFNDLVAGQVMQYLLPEAKDEIKEFTQYYGSNQWQYDSVMQLRTCVTSNGGTVPDKTSKFNFIDWTKHFVALRNCTRGHGAMYEGAGSLCIPLYNSLKLVYDNCRLFKREWAYIRPNLNGKHNVIPLTNDSSLFDFLKRDKGYKYDRGLYVFYDKPRPIELIWPSDEATDFFFCNGGVSGNKCEGLSYYTNNRTDISIDNYLNPPGKLPSSETEGKLEMHSSGNGFTNAPNPPRGYIRRLDLENTLHSLLCDEHHPIITLVGRGGIGKTSLALHAIQTLLTNTERYDVIFWFSSRDVDLLPEGPKPVQASVVSWKDMAKHYCKLMYPNDDKTYTSGDRSTARLQESLTNNSLRTLFVFDNFETTDNPLEIYKIIDTYIRPANKVLITTRYGNFKGDYDVEVPGMSDGESRSLIDAVSSYHNVGSMLTSNYIDKIVHESDGHPYVIKILLGEVAASKKLVDLPRTISATDDILNALFDRTFNALPLCAQRIFLTLAQWHSAVPKFGLQAVLMISTGERDEVEKAIDLLVQYSLAEVFIPNTTEPPISPPSMTPFEYIELPLAAYLYGKKKYPLCSMQFEIKNDVETLRMFGVSNREDMRLGIAIKIETFMKAACSRTNDAAKVDTYTKMLEYICGIYPEGNMQRADWLIDVTNDYKHAAEALEQLLASSVSPSIKYEAYAKIKAIYEHMQSYERLITVAAMLAKDDILPINELSTIANSINTRLSKGPHIPNMQSMLLSVAGDIFDAIYRKKKNANGDDYSRMVWLAKNLNRYDKMKALFKEGIAKYPDNYHLQKFNNV